jgi:hypothetical protein
MRRGYEDLVSMQTVLKALRLGQFEAQRGVDLQAEPPPAGLFDAHRCHPLVEAPFEQDQPAFEVVPEGGQFETWVAPELPVGEVDPTVAHMIADEPA